MEKNGSVLMRKYDFGRLLGQGSFAKVYYGRDLGTGESVAIKVIDKEKVLKVGLINQTKREISVMGLVKHPNVMRLYEVMATKTKIYFVMEYAKGGELFAKVAKGRLKEDVARKYFQQLISAVSCCHSRGVYHRDLKPENLLLDEDGNLKVSDFGLSAMVDSKRHDGLLHTTCGTPAYVSPEVINRKGYDGVKADIWSCGVVLFVLLAGHLPFHDTNLMEMYRKISKAEYKFPNWFSSDVRRFLTRILDPNPHTRYSISKIMNNPWFKKGLEGDGNIRNDSVIDIEKTELKVEMKKPTYFNAFDIISLSTGFDLSSLFVANDEKEVKFTSKESVESIVSKFEAIAESLNLKVMKKEGGIMKLEGFLSKWIGDMILSIDVEIFEITDSFHLVEVKRSSGDSMDYRKMLTQDIKPALKEIVWTWQGDEQLSY